MENGDEIKWEFDFSSGGTIQLNNTLSQDIPAWVRLTYHQCESCTLSPEHYPVCPVAEVLEKYAFQLRNHVSFENVSVKIVQEGRGNWMVSDIPLQTVVGELVRLAVFQYGCPVGRRVKSAMVELPPFPDNEQILGAFEKAFSSGDVKSGKNKLDEKDVNYLNSLQDLFSNICYRLEDTGEGDANINGVIMLHSLSTLFALLSPADEEGEELANT